MPAEQEAIQRIVRSYVFKAIGWRPEEYELWLTIRFGGKAHVEVVYKEFERLKREDDARKGVTCVGTCGPNFILEIDLRSGKVVRVLRGA